MKSNTFCIMPFIHQNIKHEGKITACCRAQTKLGDSHTHTLADIWNNDETVNLRRALLNDEKPSGCSSCWDFESMGVVSMRQDRNKWAESTYNISISHIMDSMENYKLPLKPATIELRFDNTCNLKCRHCSPTYSSQWEVAAAKTTSVKNFFIHYGAARKEGSHDRLSDSIIEEAIALIPHLKEVTITGGEPLLQKQHWHMMESMMPYASGLSLDYNSNLSVLGIGDYSVLNYWPKFKKVNLRVSVDGYEQMYSYFRTNGDIHNVISNIALVRTMPNVNLSITTTVSVYNISRIRQIIKFVNDNGVWFHTSLVQHPKAISPNVLPAAIKKIITDDWSKLVDNINNNNLWEHSFWDDTNMRQLQIKRILQYGNYVIDYMNGADKSSLLPETKKYIDFLDYHNDTDFTKIYPDLAVLVK